MYGANYFGVCIFLRFLVSVLLFSMMCSLFTRWCLWMWTFSRGNTLNSPTWPSFVEVRLFLFFSFYDYEFCWSLQVDGEWVSRITVLHFFFFARQLVTLCSDIDQMHLERFPSEDITYCTKPILYSSSSVSFLFFCLNIPWDTIWLVPLVVGQSQIVYCWSLLSSGVWSRGCRAVPCWDMCPFRTFRTTHIQISSPTWSAFFLQFYNSIWILMVVEPRMQWKFEHL